MFLIRNVLSQNLIQNGSFENIANVDCYGGFYNGIIPNAHVLDYWYQFNSPDYFNSLCGAGGYSVPKGYFGYSTAKNGNAYVGISLYQGVNSEYKEYFYQQLQSPLVAGDIYCLNFFITRADRKEYAVKQIGAYFSNTLPTLVSFSYINAIPQVENQGNIITDTTQWIQIQGCFTALGGEQYVTFGNFHDNSHTDTLNAGTNDPIVGDPKYSYYYIDDITLINQSTVGLNGFSNVFSLSVYPNPANNIINFQFSNAEEKRRIELYDAIGNLVLVKDASSFNLSLTTRNLNNGVFFYHILVGEKTIKTDKIVIVK